MPKQQDLTSMRFGELVVVRQCGQNNYSTLWECRCDCGGTKIATSQGLRNKHTRSCGCRIARVTRARCITHGKTNTKVFRAWSAIFHRCRNQNNKHYKSYGGRGITICERWEKFENFFADMGEPKAGESLDRIDHNGNYEPENCRWASWTVQANNKRTNRRLDIAGETKTVAEWSRVSGISQANIHQRLRLGWPVELAVFQPIINNRARKRTSRSVAFCVPMVGG